MRKRLPPLFSLQVFEAAARHGKFSLAADELALTQSAVSRQIKQLEEWYGHALFKRSGPRVDLSHQGLALLERLSAPLHSLHSAFYQDQAQAPQHLHINTLASVLDSLLMPDLQEFRTLHPEIQLNIQTDYSLHSLPPQLPMVAIRYTSQANPDLHSQRLLDDYLIVVGAPALVQQLGQSPNAWPSSALLRHSYMDWSAWSSDPIVASHLQHVLNADGPQFNDALMLLNAAKHGLGLCLSRLSLAYEALQTGALVLASPHVCASPLSFFLEYRHDCAELHSVKAFSTWVTKRSLNWRSRQDSYLKTLAKNTDAARKKPARARSSKPKSIPSN